MASGLDQLGKLMQLKQMADASKATAYRQQQDRASALRQQQTYDLDLEKFNMAKGKVDLARTDRENKVKWNQFIADRLSGGEDVGYESVQRDILSQGGSGAIQAAKGLEDFIPKTATPQGLIKFDTGNKIQFLDPQSREVVKEFDKTSSPTSERYAARWKYKDETALRKEFQDRPIVKDFEILQPQYERVQTAMDRLYNQPEKDREWVAVDQTLITILNKMLDPTSVVRESEYERTPKNLSLLNRFKGMMEKWTTGGAGLTNKDRDEIAYMAEQFYDISKTKYENESSYFSDIAKDNKFNPYNIIRKGRVEGKAYKSRFDIPEQTYTAEQEDTAFDALGSDATDEDLDSWLLDNYGGE